MAQFDIHSNPNRKGGDLVPYVMDIQADCLHGLPTRILVPLARPGPGVMPTRHLNPVVEVNGEALVMLTDQLSAIPAKILAPPVASLAARRHDMIAALDFLFTGI
ncbi:plasmid maintenance protein CcdB [Paramagnetospirillum kuznetsovii]|uniref:Toxin CcdB n=1 Tax=Paramagnetospirillum kuznetsovii TaxID=2053833 RepID=A0A364P3D5_9PROT|nr:CcdB family protein [Paramagnetospirillum kuznetsovii]RAU23677.1 plasmid maintenance protein CcdB [Paramagnetospirillum kuznetsovii]